MSTCWPSAAPRGDKQVRPPILAENTPSPPMSLLLICTHTAILVSLVVTALRAPDSGGVQPGGDGEGRVRMYCCSPLFRPSPSVAARGLRGRFRCCHVRHQEFHLAGEAFSSPMTCFDTPFPQHSHFTLMPIFLGGVSVHPRHQARHLIPFEDQFTDPTSFSHSVLVSLDFPSVVSVAAARFFRKRCETTAAGHTVVLVGGFRDCPSNRRIRRILSHIAPVGRQDAMLLLSFPKGPFPARGR